MSKVFAAITKNRILAELKIKPLSVQILTGQDNCNFRLGVELLNFYAVEFKGITLFKLDLWLIGIEIGLSW